MKTKRRTRFPLRLCSAAALLLVISTACAQAPPRTQPSPQDEAARGATGRGGETWRPARFEIKPGDLPPPNHTPSATNFQRVVARPEGARLQLPPGFEAAVYAEGDFDNARWMALAPNGDVFVSDAGAGKVFVLRDRDADGRVDERFTFAEGLTQPFGMAFHENFFYVANTDAVLRFPYRAGQTRAEGQPQKIADLPGRGYRQHWTRNLIFSPDGKKLYVSVGSETNVDVEPEPMRAAVTEFNPDGTGKRVFASGLRNPIGLAFHPSTGTLYTAVNERDGLGDDLVPDYLTGLRDGAFYGWPYSYIGQNVDPRRKGERPDLVQKAVVPDLLIQSHSAALGLVFYDGAMFPSEYRGDAFVALHGSWNRARPTGYKIIRVPFRDGRPANYYEDFLTGWLHEDGAVWGRPVGLLVHKDGSLLITDDGADKIWRVTYTGKR